MKKILRSRGKGSWVSFIRNYKMLLSTYLLMLIIPLSVFSVSIVGFRATMKKETLKYQRAVLSQATFLFDSILNQADLAVNTLITDSKTTQLIQGGEIWDGRLMFTTASLVNELLSLRNSYECVDSFGIYFFDNDSFVTETTRYVSPRQEVYLSRFGITSEQFIEASTLYKGFFLIYSDTGTWIVLYQNAYNYSNRVRTATAYAVISCEDLTETAQYLDTLEESNIFIMDNSAVLIGSTNDSVSMKIMPSVNELSSSIEISGKGSRILGVQSEKCDIYYGIYLSERNAYQQTAFFILCCIAAVILSFSSGTAMAVYFTRKTAAPIDHLLSMIHTNSQNCPDEFMSNGFLALEEELLQLKKDNTSLSYQADSYSIANTENVLRGFLEGVYTAKEWLPEITEKIPLLQSLTNYQVVLFCFYDLEKSSFIRRHQENSESYQLLFFAFKNVIDEAFLELDTNPNIGLSLRLDNRIACIISTDLPQHQDNRLADKAMKCVDFFQKILEVRTCVTFSNPHCALSELPEAYAEAYQTANQLYFWGKDEAVSFYYLENTTDKSTGGSRILDLKRQFLNCLLTNDFEKARQVMDTIISTGFNKDIRYLSYNQCQAHALASLLLDKLEDARIQSVLEKEYADRFIRARSVRELRETMNSIFDDIIDYRRKNLNEPEWVEQMKLYIQENYQDSRLNISFVAEHFSMTPSHIGNAFRRQAGIGILDYIHLIRLEEGKKLLLQGKTVKYCAQAIGYTDVKTFQRAFKNYEGCNPGQYRENYLKNQETRENE